ncbi:DNA-directed RNA polymerase subunit beta'' [Phtheirospermum japonicum]|uniref:DNA-directed RNA polymerase subunit beta n=1 Tax=Phtheirospermum japonicum TaxID=374723 RepID=A0A830C8Y4_9LAMI|nr:DNA-directed RNA polymerase subunit beta'' [Phtheirospermum japonicum]
MVRNNSITGVDTQITLDIRSRKSFLEISTFLERQIRYPEIFSTVTVFFPQYLY